MKRLCLILFVLCLLVLLPAVAEGMPERELLQYRNYTYFVEEDQITIAKYTGNEVVVSVPAFIDGLPVVRIGERAFAYCQGIWHVLLPDTVLHIDSEAFDDCSLRNILLPEMLQTIGEWAFSRSELSAVYIPASVTSIGCSAFSYCGNLVSVSIQGPVKEIPERAFFECVSLRDVHLPETVETIEVEAFYFCPELYEINYPQALMSIGDGAFFGCDWLRDLPPEALIEQFPYWR